MTLYSSYFLSFSMNIRSTVGAHVHSSWYLSDGKAMFPNNSIEDGWTISGAADDEERKERRCHLCLSEETPLDVHADIYQPQFHHFCWWCFNIELGCHVVRGTATFVLFYPYTPIGSNEPDSSAILESLTDPSVDESSAMTDPSVKGAQDIFILW